MAVPRFQVSSRYMPRNGDVVVLPYLDKKTPGFPEGLLPGAVAQAARAPKKRGGKLTLLRGAVGGKDVLVRAVRLDTEHSDAPTEAKKAVVSALESAPNEDARRVVVFVGAERPELLLAVQEGALLGGYVFDRYVSKKKRRPDVLAVTDADKGAKRKLDERATLHECVNFSRDIVNEPPDAMNPPALARAMARMGKASGLEVTVWDEKRLAKEKCGGVLAVGRGARAKPRMVISEHAPRGAKRHLCLVGKGVTYDSGGYNLKPSESMMSIHLKFDMSGAAMMFGAACAIARLGLPIRVTCITPLAENAVSGDANLPDSILTTRSGRTVEVRNTDAEGRLLLADALTLACERKPDWVIDAATLTGACIIALGWDIAGVYGTDADFTRAFIEAGAGEGERLWELPLHMPYAEELKTPLADCKNVGGKMGGSITGALFLHPWAPEGVPWIHCDIAGPGLKDKPLDHLGEGSKGFGVRAVVALARRLAEG